MFGFPFSHEYLIFFIGQHQEKKADTYRSVKNYMSNKYFINQYTKLGHWLPTLICFHRLQERVLFLLGSSDNWNPFLIFSALESFSRTREPAIILNILCDQALAGLHSLQKILRAAHSASFLVHKFGKQTYSSCFKPVRFLCCKPTTFVKANFCSLSIWQSNPKQVLWSQERKLKEDIVACNPGP